MNLEDIMSQALNRGSRRVAVAGSESTEALLAVLEARKLGLVTVTLCGDLERTRRQAAEAGYDLTPDTLIEAPDAASAARLAVAEVAAGRADLLMKGGVPTGELLRAVLDRDSGLRKGQLLSHVGVFQVPGRDRPLFLTDAGVNISPTLAQKAAIVQNAVDLAVSLGVSKPKVAVLAAIETVNLEMPATVDAAALTLMARRGQIRNAVVDGPLALDNAISTDAADRKGVGGPVAGQADVLLVPDIEAGNVAYKLLLFAAGARAAGIVTGARVPIITTSRSEGHDTKLLSIAVAVYLSAGSAA